MCCDIHITARLHGSRHPKTHPMFIYGLKLLLAQRSSQKKPILCCIQILCIVPFYVVSAEPEALGVVRKEKIWPRSHWLANQSPSLLSFSFFVSRLLVDAQPITKQHSVPFQVTPPLYILGILWNISLASLVSCPDHALSQLFVYLLTGRAWNSEKSLTRGKHHLTTSKTSVYHQHYSHTESETQQCTSY